MMGSKHAMEALNQSTMLFAAFAIILLIVAGCPRKCYEVVTRKSGRYALPVDDSKVEELAQ